VDEKSQIQALDRTQPILPLRPGLPARQTHDYERHGTTTLFAALNVLEGTVIAACQPRHRHQEFLQFLNRIDEAIDSRKELSSSASCRFNPAHRYGLFTTVDCGLSASTRWIRQRHCKISFLLLSVLVCESSGEPAAALATKLAEMRSI
jgi:hypothetical protein